MQKSVKNVKLKDRSSTGPGSQKSEAAKSRCPLAEAPAACHSRMGHGQDRMKADKVQNQVIADISFVNVCYLDYPKYPLGLRNRIEINSRLSEIPVLKKEPGNVGNVKKGPYPVA